MNQEKTKDQLKDYTNDENQRVNFGTKEEHVIHSHCQKLMKQGQNLMKTRMAQSWKHQGRAKQQCGLGKNTQIFQPQQPNGNASLGKLRKKGERKSKMINNMKQSRSVENYHETKVHRS